jgi:hypothetical protein
VLNGGSGNDQLNGGTGKDQFQFGGGWGQDKIADFSAGAGAGDVIAFANTVFADFAAVMAATADDGLGNTVITKGAHTLTLTGVTRAQLNADDFQFVAPGSPAAGKEADALTLPPLDELDPLVLPVGLEGKTNADDLPVICPPGGEPPALERPWIDLAELGLSTFDGRDPHRFQLHTQDYAWIV